MKQVRRILFLTMLLIFSGLGANAFGQNLIEVFDGRNPPESPNANKPETEIVKKEVLANETKIKWIAKNKEFKCDEDDPQENLSTANVLANLRVYGALKGSFTKPKTLQKAYFYHLCWSDATALGGILIVEKQKVVLHFLYVNVSGFDNIRLLPDINRNGLSEVVLGFVSKIDGLMIGRSIGIVEFGAGKIANLGEAETFDMQPDEDLACRISVKASKMPVFYREIYTDDPESKMSNWKRKEKMKPFLLDKVKSENDFDFVKF